MRQEHSADDCVTDEDIDFSDIPELTDEELGAMRLVVPNAAGVASTA